MTYPGGKNSSGVYQKIINQIPPHRVYIEPFLGGGAVLRMKATSTISIGIDADLHVIETWQALSLPGITIICDDGISWLANHAIPDDTFIYLDPPYLIGTRRTHRKIYRYELSDQDHDRLLEVITGLRCSIAISGYFSDRYAKALAGWRLIQYQARTRGGSSATECLWLNYPVPFELHDYRYLGSNFRERERIKRKQKRWEERLKGMPALERYAMLSVITTPKTAMVTSAPSEIAIPDPEVIARNVDNRSIIAGFDDHRGTPLLAMLHHREPAQP